MIYTNNLPESLQVEALKLATDKTLPLFCEYAYDFENNELILENGLTVYVYRNEALKVWLFKALSTERYKYDAYSKQFGSEAQALMGEVISTELKKAELRRYIVEAIMVNPYVKAIEGIDIALEDSQATVSVQLRTIYEGEVVEVSVHI